MGILERVERRAVQAPETRSPMLSDGAGFSISSADVMQLWGVQPGEAGVHVTVDRARRVAVLSDCVRVIAEDIAASPLLLYQRLEDDDREVAKNQRLYTLLHDRANPEMDAFNFKETLQGHLGLYGNAYAEIEKDSTGRILWLWPLRPDAMQVFREKGEKRYLYTLTSGQRVKLMASQVLHISWLSYDGMVGLSPIQLGRDAIGLAAAAEQYGSAFFGQGASPSGVIEAPQGMTDKQYSKLKESWNEAQSGLTNASRTAILRNGVTWKQVGIPPEQAQFLETRRFQVEEVCRLYRMKPYKVGYQGGTNRSTAEQDAQEHVTDTILPWARRWEQAINMQLVGKPNYYAEFNLTALLRADHEARFRTYAIAIQNGIMSVNEARRRENMNGIGPDGDTYLRPKNMDVVGEEGDEGSDGTDSGGVPTTPGSTGTNQPLTNARSTLTERLRLLEAHRLAFRREAERAVKRETRSARRALKKGEAGDWAEKFYPGHQEELVRLFTPVMRAYAEAVATVAVRESGLDTRDYEFGMAGYVNGFAERSVTEARTAWGSGVTEEALERWEAELPEAIADEELVRLGAWACLRVWGDRPVRWVPQREECADHANVIGRHPPAERGCTCMLELL